MHIFNYLFFFVREGERERERETYLDYLTNKYLRKSKFWEKSLFQKLFGIDLALGVHYRKHCLQFLFLQRNQLSWVLSCPRRQSVWPSLLITLLRTFSLLESQCVFTPLNVFSTQAHHGKPRFSRVVNIFFIKICFSVHITNLSINFTWFPLFSLPKFQDRPLFKSGALWFATIFNWLKRNILGWIK